ncbi:MAG TPA: ABC transporter substrate-binding protein [Rhodopila sp.]|nr:ABC transporter substrate-binding protein [Rhodopila sp.]
MPLLAPPPARAKIPKETIKIGVLQDLPEPYASETGDGGIVAAQLAASEFEKEYLRADAEILPGTASGGLQDDLQQVRDWLDKEHVAAVVSSAPAPVNQRIAKLLEQQHRTLLVAEAVGGATTKLCSPAAVIWGAGENARMRALAYTFAQQNKNRWYFVSEQNPVGLASHLALQDAVAAQHGQIVGNTEHVVGALDFGKTVAAVNKSNADVAVLAEGDGDLITALRGLTLDRPTHPVSFVAPYAQINDIDQAGPSVADGLVVVSPFYWNEDDQTRRFARLWSDRMQGRQATQNAADVYAATLSFLHAAKAADDIDAGKVGAQLRRGILPHTLLGPATVRPDGRVVYDVNVYAVKRPDQIQHRWDYYRKIATVPAEQAFPPRDCGGVGPKTARDTAR